MIYYMVTGMNAGGHLVNAGQTITRKEAMRLYTADNGWFFREEDRIGSIETGRLGDLVVLSDDYFDPKKVSRLGHPPIAVRSHGRRRQGDLPLLVGGFAQPAIQDYKGPQ